MQQGLRIVLLTLFCLAAFAAAAQQGTPSTLGVDQSSQPKPSTSKSKEKPILADATRVSTAEAVRKAAKEAAKGRGGETASEASGAPDVLEFRPAGADSQGSAEAAVAPAKGSKKSALKNIHGDAYGASDSHGSARRAGGSVGATSKSGKSSIYVQTDRQTASAPAKQ